jgi:hypothetical protein
MEGTGCREEAVAWCLPAPLRCQDQEPLLKKLNERRGVDVFVATFTAVQKPNGDKFSYCVWANGVDSLLPMAQNIFFIREVGSPPAAIGSWERVREVVGSLMEQTDNYPTVPGA